MPYADGGRYAVAVFTRADRPFRNERRIDDAMRTAAVRVVEWLRAGGRELSAASTGG
jgi:hypothetical protein